MPNYLQHDQQQHGQQHPTTSRCLYLLTIPMAFYFSFIWSLVIYTIWGFSERDIYPGRQIGGRAGQVLERSFDIPMYLSPFCFCTIGSAGLDRFLHRFLVERIQKELISYKLIPYTNLSCHVVLLQSCLGHRYLSLRFVSPKIKYIDNSSGFQQCDKGHYISIGID